MLLTQAIYVVFHIFIDLSVEPPPVAKIEFLWGDQANALTAAVCSVIFPICLPILGSHINTILSFPPEANNELSEDHLRPHIYC